MVMRRTSATGTENSHGHGFTLVELLIALALVAVLSAMMAPMLLPSAGRTLQASGQELAQYLRETRRQARAKRQTHIFTVDTANQRYQREGSERWQDLPDGMTVELTTARSLLDTSSRGRIVFNPDGSSTGGRVELSLNGLAKHIDVEWLTGKIRVAEVER